MRPLLTPEQMAAADEHAIRSGVPGFVLMERAGSAVARTVIRLLGGRYGHRVLVVCGKGNNGGDGYVVARRLKHEGMSVRVASVVDPAEMQGDAARQRDLYVGMGDPVEAFDERLLPDADLIVDAVFGTGFRGRAEGAAADAISAIDASAAPVVAVDIPSGVDGLTGAVEGPAVHAHTTVVMAAQKLGTAVAAGPEHAGDIEVVDIGIPVNDVRAWIATAADVARAVPTRAPDAHKRSVGSVAVLGGAEGMSGAAILTARAAMRMGAGYTTIGLPRCIDATVSAVLPEVLTVALSEGPRLSEESLVAFKSVLARANALAVGPGMGDGDGQQQLVAEVLQEVSMPVVIDADGLNVLSRDSRPLVEREAPTVVTPHPAELARLLGTQTSAVQVDRVAAVSEAARRFSCVVVLKGHRSLIAHPDGRLVVNTTGTAQLATAGTGDVLTGALAALLAAGCDAFDAAWAAVHLHGIAGEIAAVHNDGHGVVAWDVAESLPRAVAVVEDFGWD